MKQLILAAGAILAACTVWAAGPGFVPSRLAPPAPLREFRGAWIATVVNIDWPSKPGLPSGQQQAELRAMLDRCVALRLNAVILQVRPQCDALYSSPWEPWSEFLSGVMGKAPEPHYDPLEFAVREAHARGLELHAWFNPYRVRHFGSKSPLHSKHVSRAKPDWVRTYGHYLWLDPGQPGVAEHALKVILDVVRRYDIDGVHLDDYFYPYPENDAAGKPMDFPDEDSWQKFGTASGLTRDDWRRRNVDQFVERLYRAVHAEKPHVKVGLSPFGIWRPGYPAAIRGLDQYAKLYADARRWLMEGWVDYFTPQLYWAIGKPEQSYTALLSWWAAQNSQGRHLWPGNNAGNVGSRWKAEEIVNQVRATRRQEGAGGNVFFSMKCLLEDQGGVAGELARQVYGQPALIPASRWLPGQAPGRPKLAVSRSGDGLVATWDPAVGGTSVWWVLQVRRAGQWSTEILPGRERRRRIFVGRNAVEAVALSGVDRTGKQGPGVTLAPASAGRR